MVSCSSDAADGKSRDVFDVIASLYGVLSAGESTAGSSAAICSSSTSPARILLVTDFSADYSHQQRCVHLAAVQKTSSSSSSSSVITVPIEIIAIEHGSVVSMLTSGLHPFDCDAGVPQSKRRRTTQAMDSDTAPAAQQHSNGSDNSMNAAIASPVDFASFYASFDEAVQAFLDNSREATAATTSAFSIDPMQMERNAALALRLCSGDEDDGAFLSLERWKWVSRAVDLYCSLYSSFLRQQPSGSLFVCSSAAWWRGGEAVAAPIVDQIEENIMHVTESPDIYPGGHNIAFRAFEDLFDAGVLCAEGIMEEVFNARRTEEMRKKVWVRIKKYIARDEYRRYCIHLIVIKRLINCEMHIHNQSYISHNNYDQFQRLIPTSLFNKISDALKAIPRVQYASIIQTSPVEILSGTSQDTIFNAVQSSLLLGASIPQGTAACYWLLYLLSISPTAQIGFRTASSEISENSLISLQQGTCLATIFVAEVMEELLNRLSEHGDDVIPGATNQSDNRSFDGIAFAALLQKLSSAMLKSFSEGTDPSSKDYRNSRKQWIALFHSPRSLD